MLAVKSAVFIIGAMGQGAVDEVCKALTDPNFKNQLEQESCPMVHAAFPLISTEMCAQFAGQALDRAAKVCSGQDPVSGVCDMLKDPELKTRIQDDFCPLVHLAKPSVSTEQCATLAELALSSAAEQLCPQESFQSFQPDKCVVLSQVAKLLRSDAACPALHTLLPFVSMEQCEMLRQAALSTVEQLCPQPLQLPGARPFWDEFCGMTGEEQRARLERLLTLAKMLFPELDLQALEQTLDQAVTRLAKTCPEGPKPSDLPPAVLEPLCAVVSNATALGFLEQKACGPLPIPAFQMKCKATLSQIASEVDQTVCPGQLGALPGMLCAVLKEKAVEERAVSEGCKVLSKAVPMVSEELCATAAHSAWNLLLEHECPAAEPDLLV